MTRALTWIPLSTIALLGTIALAPVEIPGMGAIAQTQIRQDRQADADRLFEEGDKFLKQNKYEDAIRSFQKALLIYQELKERQKEGLALKAIGNSYLNLKNYEKALEFQKQALAIAREVKDLDLEARSLYNVGLAYHGLKQIELAISAFEESIKVGQKALDVAEKNQSSPARKSILQNIANSSIQAGAMLGISKGYSKALDHFQYALTIRRELHDQTGEATALYLMGLAYHQLKEYSKSLESYQQALEIRRQIGDKHQVVRTLMAIGGIYNEQKNYAQALEIFQESLVIQNELKNSLGQAEALTKIGWAYHNSKQYQKSLDNFHLALSIYDSLKESNNIAWTLYAIGSTQNQLNQPQAALKYLEKGLALFQKTRSQPGIAASFHALGRTYHNLNQYRRAIEHYQKALEIYKSLNSPQVGYVLASISNAYQFIGEFQQAKNIAQTALEFFETINDRRGKARALAELGKSQTFTGNYQWVIEKSKAALEIFQELNDFWGQADALTNLGNAHHALGEYNHAIVLYQKAESLFRQSKDREGEGLSISNQGYAYLRLGNYQKALEKHQQALKIAESANDVRLQSMALLNIGLDYEKLKKHDLAIDHYQRSLRLTRKLGDGRVEGYLLDYLGNVYQSLQQPQVALDYYQQALVVSHAVGDRDREGLILSNLAELLVEQQNPIAAIVFYKQSVNLRESIRQDIRTLPLDSQLAYQETIASSYRQLAELLITQGRILEAQQVLELLKVQELKDFDPAVRAKVGRDGKTIDLDPSEKAIVDKHETYITFAQQLNQCEAKNESCEDLKQKRKQAREAYNTTVKAFGKAIQERQEKDKRNFLDPNNPLNAKAQEIIRARPNTALIYTLVTEKRLWIVLATQSEVLRSFEVDVSLEEISKKVGEFQKLIKHCEENSCTAVDTKTFQTVSQQLYTWLFPKDLQAELNGTATTPKVENLVFALDRVTRYIPMSALFNGQKYLLEDYTISTIVSADSTRSEPLPAEPQKTKVLALGLSDAKPPQFPFPLAAVTGELNSIVRDETDQRDAIGAFPGRTFLNQQFTTNILEQYLPNRQILHIATHGEFVGGTQEQSYILLGNGHKLRISELLTLYGLPGVNLVVLSACQTALADRTADGIEISSVGNAFFEKGVKSVVASLWNVRDRSTSLLMQEFYTYLAQGKTKSEALRQAQLELMTGKKTEKDAPRSGDADISIQAKPGRQLAPRSPDFTHPYYWAPFILIGNGL